MKNIPASNISKTYEYVTWRDKFDQMHGKILGYSIQFLRTKGKLILPLNRHNNNFINLHYR
jgi:hypothetical protein